MNKRKLPRMLFDADVEIITNDKTILGEVGNISMSGIFVKTDENITVNTNVEIILLLGGKNSKLPLQLSGVIMRSDKEGIAIEFDEEIEINKKIAQSF